LITKLETCWENPPSQISLADNHIHIWWTQFDDLIPYLQQLQSLLFPKELVRAGQFVLTRDRQRFILARGFLRSLLGKYLGKSGAEIELNYSEYGKPHIDEAQNVDNLQFNLSHANDFLLVAIRKGHAVGVDVEFMRPATEVLSLAKSYFSPEEYQSLTKLKTTEQSELFFQLWTRKEAVLKNAGKGLSYSLADVEVLANNTVVTDMGVFFLASLPIAEHYQAAVSSSVSFAPTDVFCWKTKHCL
jgi:4'-phosphopantetheinyl transferase